MLRYAVLMGFIDFALPRKAFSSIATFLSDGKHGNISSSHYFGIMVALSAPIYLPSAITPLSHC